MASFTWKAPWPRRFGGGAHRPVATMLDVVRAARPDLLASTGDGSEVDLENRVMARMLVTGLRATARRVAQRDPRKLSDAARLVAYPDGTQATRSPIQRWERILGLTPARGASPRERRAAILGALVSTTSARRASVEEAMAGVFGAWYVGLGENDVADVDYPGRSPAGTVAAYWPTAQAPLPDTLHDASYPGRYSATYPWRSDLCHIAVLFQPPASADPARVATLRGKALQVLDDMLPAWMSATVSQLAPGQSGGGFVLGVSYLGLTAL
jgi:hypothetical protein